jgi:hypothetical protein
VNDAPLPIATTTLDAQLQEPLARTNEWRESDHVRASTTAARKIQTASRARARANALAYP